jgi:gamma-tubulin complex component 5
MATTTTMNVWAEQLAWSLVPERIPRTKFRKHLDHFNRMLKHHSYARTNQFEVQEKLDGLEEKFHVLNREELSDALHERRLELTKYQLRWVPDVLHLFLELSHRPLRYTQVEKLGTTKEETIVLASLKWSDIELDDPIDRHSRIWRLPDYNDFSSDDEALPSSADTSPVSQKPTSPSKTAALLSDLALRSVEDASDAGLVSTFDKHLFWQQQEEVTVTEVQVIREMLFMVQGLPTALFQGIGSQAVPKTDLNFNTLARKVLGQYSSPPSKLPGPHKC